MREYPNDIPLDKNGNVSKAFIEYIKLMFTPEEAEIAKHLDIKPLYLKEISKRLGKDRKETKAIMKRLAEKGIIQDTGGYSYFLTMPHLLNIGFKYSKAYERFGKEAAELYQQFFINEKFYKRYESSDKGTSLTRIVPVDKSIDHQSKITNAEEMHRIIDNCLPPIVATDCPCRGRTEELGTRECKDKYPIKESCLQLGPFGKYFLDRNAGRELTREEAHELVDKHAKLGLIFTTENVVQANHQIICCCCECCCSLMRGMTRFEDKNHNCSAKSNYISKVNQDTCKGCGLCVKRCIFKAITLEDKAEVNPDKCYGCGVCAVTCPTEAIKLHREERSEILGNFKELTEKIYQENRS
jgi:Pyruvate/2-oxoacid:ferredoxin oxidoreductase delta subunit/DNA-binding Lrp family transcriptional regulator